jgi:hypothetical protein
VSGYFMARGLLLAAALTGMGSPSWRERERSTVLLTAVATPQEMVRAARRHPDQEVRSRCYYAARKYVDILYAEWWEEVGWKGKLPWIDTEHWETSATDPGFPDPDGRMALVHACPPIDAGPGDYTAWRRATDRWLRLYWKGLAPRRARQVLEDWRRWEDEWKASYPNQWK